MTAEEKIEKLKNENKELKKLVKEKFKNYVDYNKDFAIKHNKVCKKLDEAKVIIQDLLDYGHSGCKEVIDNAERFLNEVE